MTLIKTQKKMLKTHLLSEGIKYLDVFVERKRLLRGRFIIL